MSDQPGAGPVRHDCAQVERDCVDLHQALGEAIRRLNGAQRELRSLCFDPFGSPVTRTDDLLAVLKRTSRPDPKITDPLRGGFAT